MFKHAIIYTQENGYKVVVSSIKQLLESMSPNAYTLEARYEEMFGMQVVTLVDLEKKGLYPDKVKVVGILETSRAKAKKIALEALVKKLSKKKCSDAFLFHESREIPLE